jgi:thymidylate synthase (FAD)
MKLIKPSYEILTPLNRTAILKQIETAGRTCYKSDSAYTEKTGSEFLKKIVRRGHLSVIEHVSFSVRFICDRGVTHELVRHRLCAFSQESTRYCNYTSPFEMIFILPLWFKFIGEGEYTRSIRLNNYNQDIDEKEVIWFNHMLNCENVYEILIDKGWSPQQARSVLPNSLKTEIVTTANLREWKHIFSLRTSQAAHPQIREIMEPLQIELNKILPELF